MYAGLQGLAEEGMRLEDRLPVVNPGRVVWVDAQSMKDLSKDEKFHMPLDRAKEEASRRLMSLVSLYTVA